MNWLIKASIQRVLSTLPNAHRWNLLFQRKVTHSLPISDEVFLERLGYAKNRIELFRQFSDKPLSEINAFEFGAGWDLEGPLAFAAMGVGRQRVVDIVRGAKLEFVNDLLGKFQRLPVSTVLGPKAALPHVEAHSLDELQSTLGITYAAPSDARATGLPPDSIDLISTNSTFEHIPKESLQQILTECHRILSPKGLMVHFIDMKDHFSYFDSSLSVYNFLAEPNWRWRLVNSSLQYQNRLRRSEYLRLFEDAGFEVIHEQTEAATEADLAALRQLKLQPEFRHYEVADLSAQILGVVLRKQR